MRIVNTQDVFIGALVPAGLLLLTAALLTWRQGRKDAAPSSDSGVRFPPSALANGSPLRRRCCSLQASSGA